jgi:hypothetical protein
MKVMELGVAACSLHDGAATFSAKLALGVSFRASCT